MDLATLLARYDLRVPRYTSYPTAAQFGPAVTQETYAAWLRSLPADAPVSLYLHVPFCDELCLYCGCNTAVVRQKGPLRAYAECLRTEIARLAETIGRRLAVCELHWGGGTPTALPPEEITSVMRALGAAFAIAPGATRSVELDPRHLQDAQYTCLEAIGINRASLGVQDFDPGVQQAIGRVQPLALVSKAVTRLRAMGVGSINMDVIYGLPRQTLHGTIETAGKVAELRPDRIAAFGYAHVPWMKKQQRLLPEDALPGPAERFAQREAMSRVFVAAGYRSIGLDHFALPEDSLARAAEAGDLRRNFQGYTADRAAVLLGIGASAIGCMPQGYVQNAASAAAYMRHIRAGGLAAVRGVALTEDDRVRADAIATLMCAGAVDVSAVAARHGADKHGLMPPPDALRSFQVDGLVDCVGDCIRLTPAGLPFMRSVAALFDAYWDRNAVRHAAAV